MANLRANVVRKSVGRRVAALRRARGWTQEQMAELMGRSSVYLSRVERGLQNLTLSSLVRLANTLETTLHELVCPGRK